MKPVLLCVSGLNPAIITETFYALAKRPHHPFIAHELAIITTGKGKREIDQQLRESGRFTTMCERNG